MSLASVAVGCCYGVFGVFRRSYSYGVGCFAGVPEVGEVAVAYGIEFGAVAGTHLEVSADVNIWQWVDGKFCENYHAVASHYVGKAANDGVFGISVCGAVGIPSVATASRDSGQPSCVGGCVGVMEFHHTAVFSICTLANISCVSCSGKDDQNASALSHGPAVSAGAAAEHCVYSEYRQYGNVVVLHGVAIINTCKSLYEYSVYSCRIGFNGVVVPNEVTEYRDVGVVLAYTHFVFQCVHCVASAGIHLTERSNTFA